MTLRHTLLSVLVIAAPLAAADDKVTATLSNPSQPATIRIQGLQSSIHVTPGPAGQVIAESSGGSLPGRNLKNEQPVPPGMHRIDGGGESLRIQQEGSNVTIHSNDMGGSLNVQVPANSALNITAMLGNVVEVSGIAGDIEATVNNGSIDLKGVSGSVVAHSINGNVTVAFDRVPPEKPMAFTTINGRVDVTLPADTKARFRVKSMNGAVYTDFDMKPETDTSQPVVEDSKGNKNGKFRVKTNNGVYGSVNGGGPEYRFETLNGTILIHKK